MNRSDRLAAILLQLQARGRQRAQDLAADLEVSTRTIYRDMQLLSEAGVPISTLPGQGYAVNTGHFLPPLMLTTLEAGMLAYCAASMAEGLEPPLRAAIDSATAKLRNSLTVEPQRELQQIQDSIRFTQTESEPRHQYISALREAIASRKELQIAYAAYGQHETEICDVAPYGLVFIGQAWHLLAYCRTRQALRNYRLDRLATARIVSERVPTGPHSRAPGQLAEGQIAFQQANHLDEPEGSG